MASSSHMFADWLGANMHVDNVGDRRGTFLRYVGAMYDAMADARGLSGDERLLGRATALNAARAISATTNEDAQRRIAVSFLHGLGVEEGDPLLTYRPEEYDVASIEDACAREGAGCLWEPGEVQDIYIEGSAEADRRIAAEE